MKVVVVKNSFLLVMIIEDWNVEEERDILVFSLSVTSSMEKAERRYQH